MNNDLVTTQPLQPPAPAQTPEQMIEALKGEDRGRMVVKTPFTLTLAHGVPPFHYGAGIHEDVPKSVREHYYTKLHLSPDGKFSHTLSESQELAALRTERDELRQRAVEAEKTVAEITARLSESDTRNADLAARHNNVEVAAREHATKVADLETRLEAALSRVSESEAEREKLEARVSELTTEGESLNAKLTELRKKTTKAGAR